MKNLGINSIKVILYLLLIGIVATIASALKAPLGFQICAVVATALIWPLMYLTNKIIQKKTVSAEATADLNAISTTLERNTSNFPDEETDNPEAPEQAILHATQWLRENTTGHNQKVLDQLPWYLCLGPRRVGKTSLLTASESDFYLLPGQRPSELQNITPSKEWQFRITDNAVYIDFPGQIMEDRLQTQKWTRYLELLNRHRKTYPFDGILISIDLSHLLRCNEKDLEQETKIQRTIIDYLKDSAKIAFPIYLIFTHMDEVPGFEPFFASLDSEDRNQVWGVTIPLSQRNIAHTRFEAEYDLLIKALYRRRMNVLSQAKTPSDQLKIFEFPIQMTQIKNKLGVYVNNLTKPSNFKELPWLRGIYFTSTETQMTDPTRPININQEELDETFADPVAVAQQESHHEIRVKSSYFVKNIFHKILYDDRNLCRSLQRPPQINQYLPTVIIATAILLSIIGTGILYTSYQINNNFLVQMKRQTLQLEDILKKKSAQPNEEEPTLENPLTKTEIEGLEQIRSLLDEIDRHRSSGVPWEMWWGLYIPPALERQVRNVYLSAIHRRFLESSFNNLETKLQDFANLPEIEEESQEVQERTLSENYDYLKLYLMLGEPSRCQSSFITAHLGPFWEQSSPKEYSILANRQLDYYARYAFQPESPHYTLNQDLILKVRQKLAKYPALDRYYKQVTTELDSKIPSVSVSGVIGASGEGYIAGSYIVPGSYTLYAYHNEIDQAFIQATVELKKDDWVLASNSNLTIGTTEIQKLKTRYLSHYADNWRKFLLGVGIRPFQNKQEAVEALNVMAGPNSPIDVILIEVARQTRLSIPPQEFGIWSALKKWFQQQVKPPETRVETEFKPLHQFVDQMQVPQGMLSNQPATTTGNASSPYSQYRASLRLIIEQLDHLPSDQLESVSQQILTGGGNDKLGFLRQEGIVNRLFDTFRTDSSSAAAKLCKQPVANVKALLLGQTFSQINRVWQEQVLPESFQLEAGYPFSDSAGITPIENVNRFLNPVNGTFETFFKTYLSGSLELTNNTYQLKESGAFRINPEGLIYINRMKKLQNILFPGTTERAEINYELTIQGDPTTNVILDIDGIHLEARAGTPQAAKFAWPANTGGNSGVRLVAIPKNGKSIEKTFPGEWGLFSFFANSNPQPVNNQFLLTFTMGTSTVKMMLTPTGSNAFGQNPFSGIKGPQKLTESAISE